MEPEPVFKDITTQAQIHMATFINFWNTKGGIIYKWTNNIALSTEEEADFKTYLTKIHAIYKLSGEPDPTVTDLNDYVSLLLSKGIDPL